MKPDAVRSARARNSKWRNFFSCHTIVVESSHRAFFGSEFVKCMRMLHTSFVWVADRAGEEDERAEIQTLENSSKPICVEWIDYLSGRRMAWGRKKRNLVFKYRFRWNVSTIVGRTNLLVFAKLFINFEFVSRLLKIWWCKNSKIFCWKRENFCWSWFVDSPRVLEKHYWCAFNWFFW